MEKIEKRGSKFAVTASSKAFIYVKQLQTFYQATGSDTMEDTNEGIAIQNALKAAETDAKKRAWKNLGPAFGQSVYNKEYLKEAEL